MKKGYILPSLMLQEYIDRYWYWETENNENIDLPTIYPGSGTELIFHYKDSFFNFPKSHILSPRHKEQYTLNQCGNIGFISVRFKSWAFKYFTNTPMDLLINKVIDAESIWGTSGKNISEQVSSATQMNERIAYLNNFLEAQLMKGINQNSEIDWAINYIYYNFNNITINDIVADTNISPRTFQRKFKASVGVSAKRFMKISRFQTVLKRSLLNKSYPSLNTILSAGYYDQAHFNKDFKDLTGENPTYIISKKSYMTHFYNTSINK